MQPQPSNSSACRSICAAGECRSTTAVGITTSGRKSHELRASKSMSDRSAGPDASGPASLGCKA